MANSILDKVETAVPLIKVLRNYNFKRSFSADFFAGLSLWAILVPQSMAYSVLAGLPPVYGLYTALIPSLVFCFLTGSSTLAVGTFSLIGIMLKQTIENFTSNFDTNLNYFELISLLTIYVSIIQGLLALFKLGKPITEYLMPEQACKGFITSSALTILTTQLSPGLGVKLGDSHDGPFPVLKQWWILLTHLNRIHIPTTLFTLGSIVTMVGLKKVDAYLSNRSTRLSQIANESTSLINNSRSNRFKIPDVLVAVISTTLLTYLFRLDILFGIEVVGDVSKGLPPFILPKVQFISELLSGAFLIAIIGYVITSSAAAAFPANNSFDPNKELAALSISSFIGSGFGAYVNCGSLTRTAVVTTAGAKSQISQITATAMVALTLAFLTPLFHYLPNACLAAVVIVACIPLLEDVQYLPQRVQTYFDGHGRDLNFATYLATFLATFALDLQRGLLLGMALTFLIKAYEKRSR